MQNLNELNEIAKLKNLSPINAEKDYLQDLILFSIYGKLGRELVFKGGTCLYKIYKLNRFSEDLDFTLNQNIDIEKLGSQIISNLSLLNIKSKIKEIKDYRNETNIKLLINGPMYNGSKETQCFIPLNISKKEKIIEEPNKSNIFSFYNEIPNFQIFSMKEEEILAEKIRAIFTRMKARDIYDAWFLLKIKKINFDSELVNKKLELYSLKFDKKILIGRINSMSKLWSADLKNLIFNELPDFEIVKKEIFSIFSKI